MVKAAGILIFRNLGHGPEVLLARRRYDPDKGFWSIPGGRMDERDNSDFLLCAARETSEEFFDNDQNIKETLLGQIDKERVTTFHIPFIFHFKTYLLPASDPERTIILNHEFHESGWFPLNKLPANTQPGVLFSIKKMKKKGWI